jgi:hypothetical protein
MARKYLFKTTPTFRKALRKLDRPLKESARSAFAIFKHESDLRAIFYIDGAVVVSLDIGDHSIYRN